MHYERQNRDHSPHNARNSAVSLRSYLEDVEDAVRSVPSAWVRCELHVLKPGAKFVRMEFIELDRNGRQVAKVNGGCFPGEWRRITADFDKAGLPLEEGSQVLVRLEAHMSAIYGFQVNVLDVDVTFALGDLSARMQSIRKHLKDAGLWALNQRMDMPKDFLRVAVIAPSGAAGLGDFRSSADRLEDSGLVRFDYHEAPFQTRDAPTRIVEILRNLYRENRNEDTRLCAIAIIRGGGASADLAWLVDQKLTEAVCRMNVPIMTGIGHERDRNLLDEVACIPCDTPSKVAEHISRTVTQAAMAGRRSYEIIQSQAGQIVERAQTELLTMHHAIDRDAHEGVRVAGRMIQEATTSLRPSAQQLLEDTRSSLLQIVETAKDGARQQRENASSSLIHVQHAISNGVETSLHQANLATERARGEIFIRIEGLPQLAQDEVSQTYKQIIENAKKSVDDCAQTIAMAQERSDALSPRNVLAAGYSILRNPEGKPLSSSALVRASSEVRAEMRDGIVNLIPANDVKAERSPRPNQRRKRQDLDPSEKPKTRTRKKPA